MMLHTARIAALALIAAAIAKIETPETKPAAVCPSVSGPAVKTEKDVKTQPYCEPTAQPNPEPTKKPNKQVEK